jgi:hypothetical protein
MNMMKTTLFCALLMTTAGVWAQTETTTQQAQKPITPYGKNPNIFHVWAYKTQEGVINTAEKVGTATEKGIQKIRPSAHQALDSAKTITNNTAATDVLTVEPPKQGNVLLEARLPNLIITPHSAWGSVDARQRMVQQLVENAQAFQAGQPIRRVN